MRKKMVTDNRITPLMNRRSFAQGLAIGGATAALNWRGAPVFGETKAGTPETLTGKNFELTIDDLPVNVTGRKRLATAVNGSMPGPTLRWREGDPGHVTNRLKERTSIGMVFVYLQRWMEFRELVSPEFNRVRHSFIACPSARAGRIGTTAIVGHRNRLEWLAH
jgi:hypothetical protein